MLEHQELFNVIKLPSVKLSSQVGSIRQC